LRMSDMGRLYDERRGLTTTASPWKPIAAVLGFAA
jgi:hypothetical protein